MGEILVFGATGDQGHPLLRQLHAKGYAVRAATREPDAFPVADFPGVRAVFADFPDQASLDAAAAGADAIVMHLPFTFDRGFANLMGKGIASAAARAGVRKIVFHTSCYVHSSDIGSEGHDGRRDIEAAIAASGVPFAIIRSAVFMDNMVRAWAKPSIVNHGLFAYPAGNHLKVSWISLEDVAAYMIAALENPDVTAHRFMTGGPEALTGHEVAAVLSEVLGKPIAFRSLHPDEFAAGMSQLVTGSPVYEKGSLYDRMAEMYRWYNAQSVSPLAVDLAPVLQQLPVRPTPLREWATKQDWTV
jgi:uncharacterized protein YbjT (DUF2867 family)